MDQSSMAESSSGAGSGYEQEYTTGVRLIVLNLPEDEGEGLGFRLTRTLWDPYPWVQEVTPGARADMAGLKMGDCLLQADGKDLLGLPVGQVAGLIRGDGAGRGVSLLVWNCGVDPKDDPELLWSCGGGSRGERSRRALAGVVRALACCVCAATATRPLVCARSHLYCDACWSRLDRCALCRETLPTKDSPYARNLVAEQVFEAIAAEYEIKTTTRRPTETASAYASPNRSPNVSPSSNRKGQYQLSMMNRKKTVHFSDKYRPAHASDPNIHRSSNNQEFRRPIQVLATSPMQNHSRKTVTACSCQNNKENKSVQIQATDVIPKINIEMADNYQNNLIKSSGCQSNDGISLLSYQSDGVLTSDCPNDGTNSSSYQNDRTQSSCCRTEGSNSSSCQNSLIQHKLVTRLRQACSLVDLQNSNVQCPISRSLNSLGDHCKVQGQYSCSLDNLKNHCNTVCDPPVFLLSAPPIYVVTCDHNKSEESAN